ncbi:hypothetical protein E3P95_03653 [Wallemia ichthyophaga]|nr:hypothetical protein E3P95_03653 [Wallemia ichthyophaga]
MDNALLSQIQGGKKLKKSQTNDRSGPSVGGGVVGEGGGGGGSGGSGSGSTNTTTKQANPADTSTAPQLGGIFAGVGMPKLRPAGGKGVAGINKASLAKPPSIPKAPAATAPAATTPATPPAPPNRGMPPRPPPVPVAAPAAPPARATPPPPPPAPARGIPAAPPVPAPMPTPTTQTTSRPPPPVPPVNPAGAAGKKPPPPKPKPKPGAGASGSMAAAAAAVAAVTPQLPATQLPATQAPATQAPSQPPRVLPPGPATATATTTAPGPRSIPQPPQPPNRPSPPPAPQRKAPPSLPSRGANLVSKPPPPPARGGERGGLGIGSGISNKNNRQPPPPPPPRPTTSSSIRAPPPPPPARGGVNSNVNVNNGKSGTPGTLGTPGKPGKFGKSRIVAAEPKEGIGAVSTPNQTLEPPPPLRSATIRNVNKPEGTQEISDSKTPPDSLGVAGATDGNSNVLQLTKDNFDHVVKPADLMLVEFYAPWCGHCKALAPQYEEAAGQLKSKDISLAKVDCVEEAQVCSENDVGGYPTLKVFRKGLASPYGGTRKSEGIVSYMTKQSLPPVSQVTPSNHDDFKQSDKVVIMAYNLKPNTDLYKTFHSTATNLRDNYLFGESDDSSVAKSAGVSGPSIVIYKSFDEGRNDVNTKSLDENSLTETININSIPLIDEIGPENFSRYATSGLPLAYIFENPEDPKLAQHVDELKPIAEEYKGKISFVWIDGVKFVEHGKALNLIKDEWPGFVIQDLQAGHKYPMDITKPVSKKNVAQFVKDFSNGKVEPSVKSEAIPAEQTDSAITLVADQFDEIVYNNEKDVFVEFYAPWCGHCKRLAPEWEALAQSYENDSSLTIAKMDATANDIPPSTKFSISSFPTLKLQPAGTKEWIDYEGDRSPESLREFIKDNRGTKSATDGDKEAPHNEHKKDEL